MKNTLVLLLIGLLITTNVVVLMLYFLKGDSSSVPSAAADVGSVASVAQEFLDIPEAERIQTEPTSTVYSAKVGKFSVDIDKEYRIIVELDGGTDGLKSTKLKIGRETPISPGVVSLAANDYVLIEAYPSNVNGTRDQFVTADTALQGNISDEMASEVDGTPARKFNLNGVGKTTKYYFERGGTTYLIEAWDISSGDTQVMLGDVLRGFSFI